MNKNIIILVSAMNLGGAQRVVSILCDQWSQKGYAVTLISTFTGKKTDHYKVHDNVILKSLTNNPFFPQNKILNLMGKLVQLRRIIKKENPSMVISFLTRVNVAAALSMLGLKSSLIICERTWTPFATLSNNFFWIYRILFKKIKRIIVQTDQSQQWLNLHFPSISVTVIPNPVSYPLTLQKGRIIQPLKVTSEDTKIILACGRLHKFKQFDLLIKAYAKIKDKYPHWNLVILGEGKERESLNKQLENLDASNRIFLPGSAGNMSEWYERADLFVLGSSVEGFPNVLLEAMSYGLPSISFDCDTGPRDMIQDGFNGVLINPEDQEKGLIRALEKMIIDIPFRKSIAENSVSIREKYSVETIMNKWNNVLDN
jgi:GalNAc-alpha-(1->4)-GalNAc-alpha-(1->3)-diNAcBac-PP-undecaprenol alpha-1,4-N-acetyl-D-galactosaminyltransferase